MSEDGRRRLDALRDSAVSAGYAGAWRAVRALPAPVASALFRTGADVASRRGGRGITRLAENLRRVVGPDMPADEFDDLVNRAVRSYARYFMEAFRLPSKTPAEHRAGFRVERGELLGEDVAAGTGCVVALGHAGNWDAAGAWVAATGLPIATVAERLRPERLYAQFLEFRRGLGMDIVPLTGGEQRPLDVMLDRLRRGWVVPLLADRDLSARGVEVTFFGARTRMPAGPAWLALRTGAPLYVIDMWYEPDVAAGYLRGPLELPGTPDMPVAQRVQLVTQMIADELARGIAAHPEDWHMLQRMWLPERHSTVEDSTDRPATDRPATDRPATGNGGR